MPAENTIRQDDPTVHDYLQIVWRRKLVIAAVVCIICMVGLGRALTQDASFRANADVLLVQKDRAMLPGVDAGVPLEDPERFAVTQARLARVVDIAQATVRAAGISITPAQLLASSSVTAAPDADFLRFSVTASRPQGAVRLATEYARQFSAYRTRLDNGAVDRSVQQVSRQLAQLRQDGQGGSQTYAQLLETRRELSTLQLLRNPRAIPADLPTSAMQIAPRPMRDLVIAAGLGIILAVAAAFFAEALDTRLRSADELADRIGLALLGRTLPVPKRTGPARLLPTVHDPSGIHAEAYRMVRLNLEFANLRPRARLVMVTSALAGEGKTLAAANLAVSFARAGRKVLLVDLDLRRPKLHEVFEVSSRPGLTDVTLGDAELGDVTLHGVLRGGNELTPIRTGSERKSGGSLALLPAGALPADPGSFVETSALAQLLLEVRDRYDIVLIDTPPLLSVGDGLALGSLVEGVLVVSRSGSLRKSEARQLRSTLDAIAALKLGLVVTDVEARPAFYSHQEPQEAISEIPVSLTATRWSRPSGGDTDAHQQERI